MKKLALTTLIGAVLGLFVAMIASTISGMIIFDERDFVSGYRDLPAILGLSAAPSLAAFIGALVAAIFVTLEKKSKRRAVTCLILMATIGAIAVGEIGMEATLTLPMRETLLTFYTFYLLMMFLVWALFQVLGPTEFKEKVIASLHRMRHHDHSHTAHA